jgi:hypothetical protein
MMHGQKNIKLFIPLAGFEPTIPASERTQTHALNRRPLGSALTNTGIKSRGMFSAGRVARMMEKKNGRGD